MYFKGLFLDPKLGWACAAPDKLDITPLEILVSEGQTDMAFQLALKLGPKYKIENGDFFLKHSIFQICVGRF